MTSETDSWCNSASISRCKSICKYIVLKPKGAVGGVVSKLPVIKPFIRRNPLRPQTQAVNRACIVDKIQQFLLSEQEPLKSQIEKFQTLFQEVDIQNPACARFESCRPRWID